MREISRVIVHCSATKPSLDIGVLEIGQWHVKRGFNEVGYHYVLRRNGEVEDGRPLSIPGAHTQGHNRDSIGICMVGGVDDDGKPDANFTQYQWVALKYLLERLSQEYPITSIHGHRDFSNKSCPVFDIKAFFDLEEFRKQ